MMFKGFAVSAALALLLSSAAFAGVGQFQGFLIGSGNDILSTGEGGALNINAITVENSQQATDATGRVTTFQTEAGSLVQGASAAGMDGILGVGQTGLAGGGQLQLHDGVLWNLGAQDQNLNANLMQEVYQLGGVGSALALQTFVCGQVQIIATPYGASANVQYVGVALYDGIGGGPDSSTVINGGVDVGADQGSSSF